MNNFQKTINNFFQIKKYFKVKKKNKINILSNLRNSKIIIKGDKNLVLIKKSDIKRLKVGIYGRNNTLDAKIGLNRTTMQELDRTQKRSLTGQ